MAFNIFKPKTKAKAQEVNDSFAFISGNRLIAIDPVTGAAILDFPIGDLTAIGNGSLVGDILARSGKSLKVYNASGVLTDEITYDTLLTRLDQATEINQGTAKVATQIQVDAGTDDATIVTPLKLANTPGASSKLLDTQTASASPTIEFNNLDNSYSSYKVKFLNVKPVTLAAFLGLRVSDDNGATFKLGAADYEWALQGESTGGSPKDNENASDSRIAVAGTGNGTDGLSNVAAESGVNGTIEIFNPSEISSKKSVRANIIYTSFENPGIETVIAYSGGIYNTVGAIDAIQFAMDTGNISSGIFKLYGIV